MSDSGMDFHDEDKNAHNEATGDRSGKNARQKWSLSSFTLNLFKRIKMRMDRWMRSLPGVKKRKAKLASVLLVVFVAVLAVPVLWLTFNRLPDVAMLESYSPVEAIKIYDIHDRLAVVVAGDEDRQAIKLKDISPIMRKAMLAAEDHEFYDHEGFSLSSIVRAAVKNFQAGRVVEGGSTITQQLVKNLFFPGEPRTINRKIKEAVLATQVDSRYDKDHILEMYLNQIYFGNQSYGIERAAQRYFSKPASKLNLAESAFLAGVVKSPSTLSNPANRAAAVKRQHVVLDKMVEYKMASAAEVAQAKQTRLNFRKYVSPYQKYPFYVAAIMDQLRDTYEQEELQRGLRVYSNLDPAAQMAGERALEKGIGKAPRGVEQGALVSVRINDGAVLALVGGVGQYEKNQWNRALSGHTMGSSFKPFVYLTGFSRGKSPDDIIVDAPVSFPSGGRYWSPRNFEGGFMGAMPIRKALALSRNVCAAKVAYEVGIKNVIETAHQAGLTCKIEPYMPISLGAAAASPLDMAGAYATFARGGVQIKPRLIRHVTNNDGRVLADYKPEPRKVFDSQAVAKLLDCLQAVVTNGTGLRARLDGRPVAGKTGTSDAARDIWFCGFTADNAVAVWGGNDHNKAIGGRSVTGGMIMAAIFKDYMDEYYAKHPTPVLAFMQPDKNAIALTSAKAPGSADDAAGRDDKKNDKKNKDKTVVATGQTEDEDKTDSDSGESTGSKKQRRSASRTRERRIEQAAVIENEAPATATSKKRDGEKSKQSASSNMQVHYSPRVQISSGAAADAE